MVKALKSYIGLYYLLFAFSYFSVYFFPVIAPLFSLLILGSSYYLIITKRRLDVVIILIFFSRCLNGFVIPHNKVIFLIINLLTNVVPIFLYFFLALGKEKLSIRKSTLMAHKFTILFLALLTISFVINFSTSYDMITKRYLPFAFFVLFALLFKRTSDFRVDGMLRFFRVIFITSLVIFFFSDYLEISRRLMESDSIFSVASAEDTFILVFFSFTRNLGPAFDHRILGIMAYLFLLLCLVSKSEYLKLDILISSVIVATTLSRGAILIYVLLLVAYTLQLRMGRLIVTLLMTGMLVGVTLYFSRSYLPDTVQKFMETFNPQGQNNALEQRSFFADYSLKLFNENPAFGKGVGHLTSRLIDRSIEVHGVTVDVIGDAYWFILLAEMGLVGSVLYLLSIKEIFFSRNLLFAALFAGFVVQLLGTDVPDMRFFFFGFLVLVFVAKKLTSKDEQELPPVPSPVYTQEVR